MIQRNLSTKLTGISSPIPFDMWSIIIIGPFPMPIARVKFIFIVVNCFIKWVNAIIHNNTPGSSYTRRSDDESQFIGEAFIENA